MESICYLHTRAHPFAPPAPTTGFVRAKTKKQLLGLDLQMRQKTKKCKTNPVPNSDTKLTIRNFASPLHVRPPPTAYHPPPGTTNAPRQRNNEQRRTPRL